MGKKVEFAAKPKKAKSVPAVADAWVSGGDPREKQEAKSKPKVAMKRLTIDIPADLHQRVKFGCIKRGLNMADKVRQLLEKEFPE